MHVSGVCGALGEPVCHCALSISLCSAQRVKRACLEKKRLEGDAKELHAQMKQAATEHEERLKKVLVSRNLIHFPNSHAHTGPPSLTGQQLSLVLAMIRCHGVLPMC